MAPNITTQCHQKIIFKCTIKVVGRDGFAPPKSHK